MDAANLEAQEEIKKSGPSIGKFSVQNPVLVTILMFTLLGLGAFSTLRLPQEQFAEVPFFWVNVIVPYPGVSAEDIESTITIPVENAFQGINQLKQISSTSSEGLSVVRVEFDDGLSNDEFRSLFQESQTRFSQVRLPDGVLEPLVDDFSSADFLPVVEVVVSGDVSYDVLRAEANGLRDRILRVKDVADVDIVGARDRQIILDIDPIRLASLGMNTSELLRAVQDQNQSIPGGTLQSGGREFLVRTLGSVRSIEDFDDIIVRRSDDTGGMIRVQDVAQVIDGFDPDAALSRFNGEEAISLRVTKVPRGSSVAVVDGTRKIVDEVGPELPWGMNLTIFNDSTVQITSSLSVLVSSASFGLLLLIVILWLFIGFRNAFIIGLGIPVTFALTFIVLEFLGETINTNTLFGLVLVLGLIVDHGIVIVENSYRLQQNGLLRHNAAIVGTNQVVLPVIAATATTVAAFLPLMLIPGTIGKFLRVIPLTVAIALTVSTFEALFFLPSHFADWGKEKKTDRKGRPIKEPGLWFEKVRTVYDRFIKKAYARRGLVLTLVVIVAVGSFALVGTLRQDLFAAEDFSYFTVDISMPRGTAIERTDEVVREFERLLIPKIGDGEVQAIRTSVGTSTGGSGSTNNSNVAQIFIDLAEQDEGRTRSIDEIIAQVQSEARYITGPDTILYQKAVNGPPTSSALSFRLAGDRLDELSAVSQGMKKYLASIDGVSNIVDDFVPGSPELQVQVNTERASALGVSTATLGNFLRARFDGLRIGTFFENNEEVAILLRFGQDQGYESLEQSFIPTEDGRLVPFSSIATIVQTESVGNIRRVEGKREINITADAVATLDLSPVNAGIGDLWTNQLALQYPSVEFKVGGEFSEFQDLLIEILRVFLFGIFLIYLILGAQFNSYSQPFLILLSVPFAFVGVILYLFFSGTPFSTTVLYAGVALAGIAVNDAIVLIDFINEQRKKGHPVREAVLEATSTRLRPIILTSLTTIGGLLPTALGIGGVSVVWGPMASTIVFGLLFSTMTALLIIPLLYGVIYDKSEKKSRKRVKVAKATKSSKERKEKELLETGPSPAPALGLLVVFGLIFLFLPLLPTSAQTSRYPTFDEPPTLVPQLNSDILNQFYQEWVPAGGSTVDGLYTAAIEAVRTTNPTAAQLASVAQISQITVDSLRAAVRPTVSVNPPDLVARNPLYSLTYAQSWTHQVGAGVRLTQPLPTAGSVRVNGILSTSVTSKSGNLTWGQSPSIGVSLDQPLFVGPGIVRFDHPANTLEKALLDKEGADAGYLALVDSLGYQAANLGVVYQSLQETRWALQQQALLTFQSLQRGDEDLRLGIISQADLGRQRIAYDQLLLSLNELDGEIQELRRSILSLGGEDLLDTLNETVFPGSFSPEGFLSELSDALEIPSVLESFLLADSDYQQAVRDLRKAELDGFLGNQADAPRLGIGFTLTPGPTSGKASFGDSLSGLFDGDSKPGYVLSVTLSASDLSRRTSATTESIRQEQLTQARLAQEEARSAVLTNLRNLNDRRNNLLVTLAIRLEEYGLAAADLQEETIRLAQGASNDEILRRRQISEYSAAFGVLQTLRSLDLLKIEVENLKK